MNHLPQNKHLPIPKLVACFNNTSATYKFYWLLSIIQEVELNRYLIPKRDLFAAMIANAWYTINYFHISFGKQDKFQKRIENIREIESISIDAGKQEILNILKTSENKDTLAELKHFNNQVPHWFLSPWFPGDTRSEIYRHSQKFKNLCPYSLQEDFISINILWANYFIENAALIKDFCYWNLALYLQDKNPNVPDIPNKLIKPALRNNLTKQRRSFWDVVISELGSVECIYKKRPLTIGDYAIEHFIPYSFVSHDLIWNLIPADKSFNSAKRDKLPSMERYFIPFFNLQKKAVKVIREKQPRNKFLEDYLSIFPIFDDPDIDFTPAKLKERIQPLIIIAANNGFEYMK